MPSSPTLSDDNLKVTVMKFTDLRLSEPILRPLRQVIPNLGMIDITPIVAYLLLGLLQSFVVGMV